MKFGSLFAATASLLLATAASHAQFSIAPLSSFGGGDGWLAPGEGGYTFLGTGNNERGMALGNDHLYLVSRNGGSNIRILDKLTGADLGALNLGSGIIAGGTFAVNMAAVGSDGAIYVANLASPLGGANATPFKVYRWANEAATPTVAYSSSTVTAGRLGDNLAVFGGGTSTRIAAGESNSAGSGSRNGYAILTTANGTDFTGDLVTFSGTPAPAAGDFRLGLTFKDANTVIGTAGGATSTLLRIGGYTGTTGTLLGSPELTLSGSQRILSFATVAGVPLLATESSGDATVRIWDMTDIAAPLLLGSMNNTTGTLAANANGTGQAAWGDISGNTAKLWTMSSNQGIQAFVVTVPEPGALTLLGLGLALAAFRRNRN